MTANGRTEVASDVKFGVGASFIELYLWSKFGDPSSYGVPTLKPSRRDDDGVRGLCHKRLRQLRWARALKIKGLLKILWDKNVNSRSPLHNV